MDIGAVSEALQPFAGSPPGYRESCQAGNKHQLQKIGRKHPGNLCYACAEHFAYAYFLNPLLCRKSYEAKQAKAGHNYGKQGKNIQYGTRFLLGSIRFIVQIVQKRIGERLTRY